MCEVGTEGVRMGQRVQGWDQGYDGGTERVSVGQRVQAWDRGWDRDNLQSAGPKKYSIPPHCSGAPPAASAVRSQRDAWSLATQSMSPR